MSQLIPATLYYQMQEVKFEQKIQFIGYS